MALQGQYAGSVSRVLAFLLGLIRRDRRALHDLIAGTAVVYAWDASTAELRAQTFVPDASRTG